MKIVGALLEIGEYFGAVRRLVLSEVINSALEKIDLRYPKLDAARRRELAKIRKALEKEDEKK